LYIASVMMMQKRLPQILYPASFVFFSLVMIGCSVVKPVGRAISSGYDNTVAYFNAYYNASRLFRDAEREIKEDNVKRRGMEQQKSQSTVPIPASASQKLTKVIDKCSNILAFHPNSRVVDDALFLIGKSFYYQGQFEKAERKFVELLTRFPDDKLTQEVMAWYALSLYNQNKYDEASEVGKNFLSMRITKKALPFYNRVNLMMGDICEKQKNMSEAQKYYKDCIEESDKESQIQALMKLGDIEYLSGNYDSAANWYLKASSGTKDPYFIYIAQTRASDALRKKGDCEYSLQILNNLLKDYRMKNYRGFLYLERGKTFLELKDTSEALADFMLVDTGYTKSPYSTFASFELGKLYEYTLGDYSNALKFYTKATKSSDVNLADSARQKTRIFTRYFDVQKRSMKADTLLLAAQAFDDSLSIDSLAKAVIDTTQKLKKNSPVISKDSAQVLKFYAIQELGDIFFTELNNPDSAAYYYILAEKICPDSALLPRLFFMSGLLAQTVPMPRSSLDYFRDIVTRFPNSPYATPAMKSLGYEIAENDSAEQLYRNAEQFLDLHEYHKAFSIFDYIEKEYPLSPYAPKSLYAKAFTYEYYLKNYDSAVVHYKKLRAQYSNSQYGLLAKKMILDSTEIPTVAPDTVAAKKNPPKTVTQPEMNNRTKDVMPPDGGRKEEPVPSKYQHSRKPREDFEMKKEESEEP